MEKLELEKLGYSINKDCGMPSNLGSTKVHEL
jgi:hypothetical protein